MLRRDTPTIRRSRSACLATTVAVAGLLAFAGCGAPATEQADTPSSESPPSDSPVFDSQSPVLVTARSEPAPVDPLPHSMKGYTLYGWERGGAAWFTLVTGTNRLKSFDELDAEDPVEDDAGWVCIRVAGVEHARRLIERVPAESYLTVQPISAVTVAQNTVPGDVQDADSSVLSALEASR